MNYRLRPAVLDIARDKTGSESDEQLGQNHLRKTGSTIRNWRTGKTTPDVVGLMRLRKITGIPLEEMLLEHEKHSAVA